MKDEALKLALEALEYWFESFEFDRDGEAITAIKQALAAPVQEPTCKQSLQVWVISNGKGAGQFSWDPQDERFWTRMESAAPPAQPAPVQEPVAWKWHQAPVKTQWGHDMVVADLAIDKDNTVSIYCERDQTAKVEAMLAPPAQPAQEDIQRLSALVRAQQITIDKLKQALATPVQEPVAIALNTGTKQGVKWLKNVEHGESLYTTPPAQPAPVQSCFCPNCEAMGKELAALKAQPHATDLTHDRWDEWQDKYGLILERDALDDLCTMLAAQPAPAQEPFAWEVTKGGAYRSGEYRVVERIDDKGWNAHKGGDALFLGGSVEFCKSVCEQDAAAPVQEPVAWMYEDMMGLVGVRVQKEKPIVVRPVTPLYTTPPAAQRQCNWPTCQSEEYQQALAEQINQELVTGAAQRQWVGLTDKQKSLDNAPPHFDRSQSSAWQDGVYWAEAKLKEKNT